jgi:hypothetical protein
MKHERPVRFFVSYSHQNKDWFRKLQPLLVFRPLAHIAHIWHDQELNAGDQWEQEIRRALAEMDIFVPLLTYEFLASEFIATVEAQEAFSRQQRGEVMILPLLVADMLERDVQQWLQFNPIPAWNRSWRSFQKGGGKTMDAHTLIRNGFWQAIDKVRANAAANPARMPGSS